MKLAKFRRTDVKNDNFRELWPAMVVAMKTASFIALDTELSGLGNRKSLMAESIEDRYKAICSAARSRSIISLGIACYKKLDDKAAHTYLVQVYNLTLLCSEEYMIEPQSVKFLVQHGFDFNKQYASGIPYLKGNGKGTSEELGVHIRALFTEVLRARKALVLHNGLIDMAFLYQSFYANLPDRLASFTADLSEMFPAGIYDTKYVTEFELRLPASYLEYAYKKCKLDNSRIVTSGGAEPHVRVEFCQYAGHMSSYVDYRMCQDVSSAEGQTDICERFSAFGWCPNGTQCPSSHDTDLIVLQDEKGAGDKKKKKRIRNKKRGRGEAQNGASVCDGAPDHKIPHMEVDSGDAAAAVRPERDTSQREEEVDMKACDEENQVSEDNPDHRNPAAAEASTTTTSSTKESREEARETETLSNHPANTDAPKTKADPGTHRAGFDAYMTGYIFAHSCTTIKEGVGAVENEQQQEVVDREQQQAAWLPTCLNKVYLSGKAAPLNVVKSTFARSSKVHIQKMKAVWAGGL
ncbi:target of EGR1 protein 1 isoform X2 [Pungitius pungitius]|uniref:target of EGR1 protein 1 isoform X2 n=1 Tax=Pungitius pungitius TaxID=134920 RepID=UPI002E0E01E9